MRTKNSFKNILIALICNIITLLITFFAQSIFIKILGIEYSGINSVFNNVISMLAVSELGIGTAIIFHLYKPIANNNIEEIKSLMNFYKKSYNIIALIILIIGLLIIPIIPNFVTTNNITENIYLIYLFFLADSIVSYLATYKRSLIYANQKNRIVDLIHLSYTLILNIVQIIFLLSTHNYILYLLTKVLCRIIENIIITIFANKMYPYLKDKNIKKVEQEIKQDIFKKIKAQIFHSVGGYIVLGTDNLIISKFFGLATAGIYGNYILIINAANTILSQIFSSLTASVGNLLTEDDSTKNHDIYKKMIFMNFLIYSVVSVVFYFSINDFILIWLGNQDYVFSNGVVLCLAINMFMQGMRRTMQTFATAAGICHENRFIPLFEALINIVASLIFLKIFGVAGVILGTIISTLILYFYSFPKYIYKPLFKKKEKEYLKEFLKFILVECIILLILYFINNIYFINNLYLRFIFKTILNIIVSVVVLIIIYFNNQEFHYFFNILQNIFKKIKKGKK